MDRTAAYVADMLDAARELVALADGVEVGAFLADRLRCLACEKLFINLGEAAKRIDTARAASIPGVPWTRVIGLRNILAHGYEEVEHEVLYRTIQQDLPALVSSLQEWLASQG
ncbi:MAG: DUF86 domain-containing protein [Burkholderiales bacterium]|nr:DUF86 domain-containing protein [Burkholderiales bacterium]